MPPESDPSTPPPSDAIARVLESALEADAPEMPGSHIGPYKLLQEIGEGGFGNVWMAEQQEPIRRRVALKIIKLGMDTREVIARFEAERQALALMDHPNIARVFDGGGTETGRPFFVMELVSGVPITQYRDAHELSTEVRQRLLDEDLRLHHGLAGERGLCRQKAILGAAHRIRRQLGGSCEQ